MSPRPRTFLTLILASGLGGGLTTIAWADCSNTPFTVTFDAGAGSPHCYTEAGLFAQPGIYNP